MTQSKSILRRAVARALIPLAVIVSLGVLSGCDDAVSESGQPGTVSVHMNGQTGTYAGAASVR
jgi:hypothetical protein